MESRAFAANFPGTCSVCDGDFERGTMIRYSGHDLVHVNPDECIALPTKTANVCPVCHVTKPCFCDA